jgi:hypothetical protein
MYMGYVYGSECIEDEDEVVDVVVWVVVVGFGVVECVCGSGSE